MTDPPQEGDSGVIELKTAESDHATSNDGEDAYDEPEIVKLMVEYFYHFDYLRGTDSELVQVSASDLQSPPQLPSQVYLIEHAKVFAIAVKYQIEGLRELAVSKFHTAATGLWKHDDFAHSVHIVFNSTAEEVTQLLVIASDILHQHFDVLKEKAEIEAVVCNIPRLAYALLKRSRAGGKTENVKTGKQSQYTEGTCSDCGLDWNSSATLSKLGRHGQGKSTSYHWYCSYCE